MSTINSLISSESFAMENKKLLSLEQIEAFKSILFQYISEGNRIGKKQEVTANRGIAAKNFAFIAIKAAEELNFSLKKLTSLPKTCQFLRNASGLSDLTAWLDGERNFRNVLEESGEEAAFKNLWQFGAYRMEKISTFEMLKKVVSDHRAWLRFISTMMRNKSLVEEAILANKQGRRDQKWSKRKVFLHYLICATLGYKTIKDLGIENLCKFSRITQNDYEAWRKDIYHQFLLICPRSTLAVELWNHSEMVNLVNEMAQFGKNHWLNLGVLIIGNTQEKKRFSEIRKVFLKTVRLIAMGIMEMNQPGRVRGFVKNPIESFNKAVKVIHPVSLYHSVALHPYFVLWLDDENILRILAVANSLDVNGQIQQLVQEQNYLAWFKFSEFLTQKLSLSEILQNLWSVKTPTNGFDITKYIPTSSDKWELGRLDTNPHPHLMEEILRKTIFTGHLGGIYERLSNVYKIGYALKKSFFSDAVLLALLLKFEKSKLPADIANFALQTSSVKMLDDKATTKLFNKHVNILVQSSRDKSEVAYTFDFPDLDSDGETTESADYKEEN